jgi:hypothetical protein
VSFFIYVLPWVEGSFLFFSFLLKKQTNPEDLSSIKEMSLQQLMSLLASDDYELPKLC